MNKNINKITHQITEIKHPFSANKLTKYAGLSLLMKFINKDKIVNELNELFPTEKTS